MGIKNINGDLDITGLFKVNGVSLINGVTITPVAQGQLYYESGQADVTFTNVNTTRFKASKLVIFTMNNSFVVTPIAQNGDTLTCGSFAYNSDGDTMIARIRIKAVSNRVLVSFDSNFANRVRVMPYAALLLVE